MDTDTQPETAQNARDSNNLNDFAQLNNNDFTLVAQHTYLGDVDDLEGGGCSLLIPGETYTLPLLPLDGVVLCPGETLPLRLLHASDRLSVARSLVASPPVQRLIAVVCCKHATLGLLSLERVGCIAELCKMSSDGTSLLAKGRQRFELILGSAENFNLQAINVRILKDECLSCAPEPATTGAAYWPPCVYARYDARVLAKRAQQLFSAVAPQAPKFIGDTLQLSFWLVANLPLDSRQRQKLLECATTAERLLLEINMMAKLSTLFCMSCGCQVASSVDVCQMNEEGISGCYVNSHAVVHDIVTLSKVHQVHLEGEVVTEHSWFPSYGWRIAYCSECDAHLGWKFEATDDERQPREFFGLRRSAISSNQSVSGFVTGFTDSEDSGSMMSQDGD